MIKISGTFKISKNYFSKTQVFNIEHFAIHDGPGIRYDKKRICGEALFISARQMLKDYKIMNIIRKGQIKGIKKGHIPIFTVLIKFIWGDLRE